MSTPPIAAPPRSRRPWLWLAVGLAGVWLLAAVRLVLVPESVLTANVVVDDALYFALPARHWWAGSGYSFDGLEPTNGVQALWALVTLGIAGVISDPLTMLRAMVAVSAACWALAALGLFVLLCRRSLPAAILAAVGMAWCGVHDRLAFTGMENGLHALVAALVLLAGERAVRRGWTCPRAFVLGLTIALMALARTEGVLLGPVVGAALVGGWLGNAATGERLVVAARLRLAVVMALPGVVLVGGLLLYQRLAFGAWLPVSGSVKALYEQQWGGTAMHGGVMGSIGWHLRHVFHLALTPLREDLAQAAGSLSGTGYRVWRNAIWVLLVVGIALALRRRASSARSDGGPTSFAWCFAVYALLHLVLMGLALPHFTNYGTWYFASEVTIAWLGIGVAFAAYRGRWRWLSVVLAVLITIAGWQRSGTIASDVITNRLRSAGQWLEQHAPAASVVGTLSSGLVGWYAPSLHVVNLDGLINNQRYLEQYLRPARVGDYFADRGISWFADYQPLSAWQSGISWCGHVPANRLVPRRYWRLADEHAYVIWQVLPPGQPFELLGDGDRHPGLVRDRYVELAVAADVHGRFPVVRDEELAAALPAHADHVVARSILAEPGTALLHVLVPRAELANIALTPDTVWPEHLVDCEPVPGVVLLGYDTTVGRRHDRPFVAVTLYWHSRARVVGEPPELALLLSGEGADEQVARSIGNCQGTLPIVEWPLDRVVAETVVFEDCEPGDRQLEVERAAPQPMRFPLQPRDVGR